LLSCKRIEKLKPKLPSDIVIHNPTASQFQDTSTSPFGENGVIPKNSLSLVVIDLEDLCVAWDYQYTYQK
jgi:hypothetical protein